MKITFKDGITVEITDYSNKKQALAEAKKIHTEFLEDKKFKDSFKIRDNKSVVKKHIYDSYEDVSELINYLEKLLDRKNINYSNIYYDDNNDNIVLEFNSKDDCQAAFELILNEDVAKKDEIIFNLNIAQILINLEK